MAGLACLALGAELLVRGASRLARAVGLPSLVIGLTVVAYGTSAPEFAVSLRAGLAGQADIALGNVVGSNTFNVLFILGVAALILPLTVSAQLVRLDVPVMIGASAAAWLVAADGTIGRCEGLLLLGAFLVYTAGLIRLGRSQGSSPAGPGPNREPAPAKGRVVLPVLLVLAGLALLVLGARWLVQGAADLARLLGAGELLVGLTVVAAGTSLPEAATSVVASVRGEPDIAVGNIVGSNIFNILAVLGATAAASPGGVSVPEAALHLDVPVMVAAAVACLPVFFTGGRISRWEGALFLGYYIAYLSYLAVGLYRREAPPGFTGTVLLLVLPGIVLGVGGSVVWARRPGKGARGRADLGEPHERDGRAE